MKSLQSLANALDLSAESLERTMPGPFVNYSSEKKNVWQGVGQGLVDTAVTTVLGAVQLVTFPIPADIAIPSPVNLSGK